MPARLLIKSVSEKKIHVEIYDANGLLYSYQANPLAQKTANDIIKFTNLPRQTVAEAIKESKVEDIEIELDQESSDYNIYIRGLYQKEEDAQKITVPRLNEALDIIFKLEQFPAKEPIFYFRDERICILDVDYHGNYKPTEDQLSAIALAVRPQPIYWWRSHGGGCKMVFCDQSGFTAKELASVAAFSWSQHCTKATYELGSNSRLPQFERNGLLAGKPIEGAALTDVEELKTIYTNQIDSAEVDSLLKQLQLEKGKTYEHGKCPIDPGHASNGHPVQVGNGGLYCYSCAGRGLHYGNCRKSGFIPYAALLQIKENRLTTCIKHFTHWEHVKYLLAYYVKLPQELLEYCYKAALKAFHGVGDIRIDMVFKAEKIVRLAGVWGFDGDSRNTILKENRYNIFRKLPTCISMKLAATGEKEYTLDNEKVEILSHSGVNLDRYGYYELTQVKGFPLYGTHNRYINDRIPIYDNYPKLPFDTRPTYLPPSRRLSEEECKEEIEMVFPGINWDYLKLLIASKGWAEGEMLNPMILVKGPSGAAKSNTVQVAAGILGDTCTPIMWEKNETRLRQHFKSATELGSFAVVDEVFKKSEVEKLSPRQALDPILNLTPNSVSHAMYIGSVPIGKSFVAVFTDIDIPKEVKDDTQLARRLLYVRLDDPVPDWVLTCSAAGIQYPQDIRRVGKKMRLACDSLISMITDELFLGGMNAKEGIEYLGASYLLNSTDFADSKKELVHFRELLCNASDSVDQYKPEGKGWKKIDFCQADELRVAWDKLADGRSGSKWETSRRCAETGWRSVGATMPCVLDILPTYVNGNVLLFLRFRSGQYDHPAAVNGEIFSETRILK